MPRPIAVLASLMLLAAPAPTAAQEWAALPSSNPDTTAVGARWPSGIGAVARCQDGRFQLLLALRTALAGDTAPVRIYWPTRGGDAEDQLWRLSPQGTAAFARQPVTLSRAFLREEGLRLGLPATGPETLTPPDNADALAAVLEACGHARDFAVPSGSVITDPAWRRRPDGRELARYVPRQALRDGVEYARVEMQCLVREDGALEDCLILSETPPAYLFGAAAIRLSEEFQMRPQTVNGIPVGEALVNIPITWNLPRP